MMLGRFVFMRDGNSVVDLDQTPQNAVMKKIEFDNCYGNLVPTRKGQPKITTKWLNHAERQTVMGERYAPGKPIIYEAQGASWFNPFHLPKWRKTEREDKVQPILDHIRYLAPDEAEYTIFMSWLAWTVHHPEIRVKFTPLLIAVNHGTGRGFVVALINKLLGAWNCSHVKMKALAGKSNDGQYHNYLHQTLFCSVPEVRVDQKEAYEVDDELRDKLTDSPLNINIKYGRNGTYDIFTNFLLASNHRDALVLSKEDRRIFVIETMARAKPDQYYKNLYAVLDDTEALAQFYWWLKAFSQKQSFNPHSHAPMTRAKTALIEGGKSEVELAFDQMVEEEHRDVMRHIDIRQELKSILIDQGRTQAEAIEYLDLHDHQVQTITKKKCVACGPNRIKIQGRGSRVYAIRNFEKWANADPSILRQEVSGGTP